MTKRFCPYCGTEEFLGDSEMINFGCGTVMVLGVTPTQSDICSKELKEDEEFVDGLQELEVEHDRAVAVLQGMLETIAIASKGRNSDFDLGYKEALRHAIHQIGNLKENKAGERDVN